MNRLARILFKTALAFVVLFAMVVAGSLYWAGSQVEQSLARVYDVAPLEDLDYARADVEVGRRIVHVRNGCVDCHGEDLGGATVIDDPAMGKISGPNLTPSALADWTEGEIARAIRHGIGKDGRALVLMPSAEYHNLSREDLAAAVAYLRTVPSVSRANEPVRLGTLAKVLYATKKLPTLVNAELIDHRKGFADKPAEEPTAEFGKYLASTACIGCHNPKFTGGPIPGAPPEWAPASDLTPNGPMAQWSDEDFVNTMRQGTTPDGRKLRAPMPLALTAQFSDVELKALWAFFRSLPVVAH